MQRENRIAIKLLGAPVGEGGGDLSLCSHREKHATRAAGTLNLYREFFPHSADDETLIVAHVIITVFTEFFIPGI